MITKWKLFNFKSVRNYTELDLGPLTIFAGSNSSGKSTVLQSMLLISQTLSSRVGSRSVILNGPLTRLGQFDDLRSFGSEAEQILVGWEIRQEFDRTQLFPQPHLPEVRSDLQTAACEVSFDVDPSSSQRELLQLSPRLFGCKLGFRYQHDYDIAAKDASISISRSTSGAEKIRQLGITNPIDIYQQTALEYDVEFDSHTLEEFQDGMESVSVVGGVLTHFLPSSIARRYNRVEAQAIAIADVCVNGYWNHFDEFVEPDQLMVPQSVFRLIADVIKKSRDYIQNDADWIMPDINWDGLSNVTLSQWEKIMRQFSPQQREKMSLIFEGVEPDFYTKIYNLALAEKQAQYYLDLCLLPENLKDGVHYLEEFFSHAVKYLGPLRDEPKPLYPLTTAADPKDIGLRGELTASVLNLNKESKISYVPSQAFITPGVKPAPVVRSLETAVLDWLQYLDVAQGLDARDRGKFGHELKVMIAGTNMPHDLTHVGVGVSQVLPILVMCLLAEPDTTLIIEQPELHLHPKVQTLLADFFLSMAMLNKQIIVETHSEYLINRLRFRSAAAQEDTISRLLQIYFVEKKEGTSVFRSVDVNKYGAIVDWPDGFFDQSQSEAEEILRAATLKRKQEKVERKDAQRND